MRGGLRIKPPAPLFPTYSLPPFLSPPHHWCRGHRLVFLPLPSKFPPKPMPERKAHKWISYRERHGTASNNSASAAFFCRMAKITHRLCTSSWTRSFIHYVSLEGRGITLMPMPASPHVSVMLPLKMRHFLHRPILQNESHSASHTFRAFVEGNWIYVLHVFDDAGGGGG